MIPYSKNIVTFRTIIKSLFLRYPYKKLEEFFREYTGKRYILITNSCRSALYLTYKALNMQGEIITSPLTCKAAIDPMVAAGYVPVFQDIDKDLLTMSSFNIKHRITNNTRGFQINHTGGVPCNLKPFQEIAKSNGFFIVEDCAQGLFAEINGIKAGTTGDFVCFSLIKNAKGIGGGILATNNEEIYHRAKIIQAGFKKTPLYIVVFRILRHLIENRRDLFLINIFYTFLLELRNLAKRNKLNKNIHDFSLNIFKPSKIEASISIIQLNKALNLNELRFKKGMQFIEMLKQKNLAENYSDLINLKPSFVKLFLYSESTNSQTHIRALNKRGIEAMHLEHKYNTYYQERFDSCFHNQQDSLINNCLNYLTIHDHIISLPFYEALSEVQMRKIIQTLQSIINET